MAKINETLPGQFILSLNGFYAGEYSTRGAATEAARRLGWIILP